MTDPITISQYTVDEPITWEGIGLHSGLTTKVTVAPAEPGFGIKFKRVDGDLEHVIMPDVKNICSTDRSTDIARGAAGVRTIEHIMAALWGASISNAEIQVDGVEIPILDGSAKPFFEKLMAHRKEQEVAHDKNWVIDEVINFTDPVSGASYTIIPHEELSIDVILSYDSGDVGGQHAHYTEGDSFSEICDARTFVLTSELEELCKKDLIKGGSLDNAVLIASEGDAVGQLSNALDLLKKDNKDEIIERFKKGYTLKYSNELARHKALDLIGDLSILGHRLKAKVIAKKPGHTGNAALLAHLKPMLHKVIKLKNKPVYDPTIPPVYDTMKIQSFLPHRYPFLLIDRIIKITDTMVVGVKNVTFNEAMFQGHFPGNPIFPGVLQMEALAQTGGLLALKDVDDPSEWDTYFLKMDNVKFKKKVIPGDTLILKMELMSPLRRGIVQMQGTAYVEDSIVSEGELTAQIIKRNP